MCKKGAEIRQSILILILSAILLPIAVDAGLRWWYRIKPGMVVGYIPYANGYCDADGKPYKGSSPSDPDRPIDPRDPLPLKFGEPRILRLGIKNLNDMQLVNVYLFLNLPEGMRITKDEEWEKNSETEYYTCLGTVNPYMLVRDSHPIYIAVDKPGLYNITYSISGNFPIIRNKILPIHVY